MAVPCHNRRVTWRFGLALLAACGSASTTTPIAQPPRPEPERPVIPATVTARIDLDVPSAPTSLVVLDRMLVWTDSLGSVWSMPSDGSAPAAQLSDAQRPNFAFHLVRAGDRVFATSRKDLLSVGRDAVRAMNLRLQELPEESAGDASALYFTMFKRTEVMRVPISGGAPTKLADVSRGVLGLHGTTLYAASYSGGTLVAIPTAGGPAVQLASNLPRPTAVAADDTAVFVYCERDKTIRRIDLADHRVSVIARDLENSDDLISDGLYLWTFTWGAQPGLVRVMKDGSRAAQRLTTDIKTPNKVAVDAQAVYVSSREHDRITKLVKSALPPP
jgi:hypothetical protein